MVDAAGALRAFMARHGLTQARLAGLLGVGRVTLSRWVNGAQPPENPTMLRLALVGLEAELARG